MDTLVGATKHQLEDRLTDMLEDALVNGKAATLLRLTNDRVVVTSLALKEPSLLAGPIEEKQDPIELRFKALLTLLSLMDLRKLTDEAVQGIADAAGVEWTQDDDVEA